MTDCACLALALLLITGLVVAGSMLISQNMGHHAGFFSAVSRYLAVGMFVAWNIDHTWQVSPLVLFGFTSGILALAGISWNLFVRAVTPQRKDCL